MLKILFPSHDMAITYTLNNVSLVLRNRQKLRRWITHIITDNGSRVGEISYLFCSDDQLLQVNLQFLSHDTYTDIITFDYVEGDLVSGDIMISVDRVHENAARFGVPFEHELRRVMIHGVLHLLGQGDKSDADRAVMRAREDAALAVWDKA